MSWRTLPFQVDRSLQLRIRGFRRLLQLSDPAALLSEHPFLPLTDGFREKSRFQAVLCLFFVVVGLCKNLDCHVVA